MGLCWGSTGRRTSSKCRFPSVPLNSVSHLNSKDPDFSPATALKKGTLGRRLPPVNCQPAAVHRLWIRPKILSVNRLSLSRNLPTAVSQMPTAVSQMPIAIGAPVAAQCWTQDYNAQPEDLTSPGVQFNGPFPTTSDVSPFGRQVVVGQCSLAKK